jgi:DNA recombination protein RmuC
MWIATTALLLIALAAVAYALRSMLVGALGGIEQRLDRRLGELDSRFDRRLESLDGRLLSTQQNAGQTTAQIVERLSKLDGTANQMLDRAKDLARLEQALRPPKARGGFGELLLANLLRDRLPADAYQLQHTFATGDRVDAVIKVEKLVPVDAKFPLDNFERLVEAGDDDSRALHEKAFARDLKGHVDAIAQKYIRPAEGTFDFALMYLPSEAVYYELVCGKTGELLKYAHGKRVFPVSPTTFTSQLQVIVLGLKGLQIEQHAHDVMAYVAQLSKDFERFEDDFRTVGTHLGHAQSRYAEAQNRLQKFERGLERATEWEADAVEPAEARELPRAV